MALNGTITLISNKGSGSSREVRIAENMTLSEVFFSELGCDVDPAKHSIMVNGKTVKNPKEYTVKDKDFVIIVPSELKGA